MARMEPLDDVHPGRNLLHLSGIDQRSPSVVYAALAADPDRRGHHNSSGVPDRLHSQPVVGLDVWDYSGMPGNILGQICPQYMLLWLPVSLAGIVLDDWIRYRKFGEERPHYRLI